MHVLFVTGFLGSGKTTFILSLAAAAQAAGRRSAVIVNEIGEIGIDNQLMRRLDLNVWELFNGCICCTLTADLVTTLQQLDATYTVDLVLVEPSGAADPKNLLHALPYYRGRQLESTRWLTMLDPLRLPMLLEVLEPLITAGIRQGDFLVLSKADLATPEELAEAAAATRAINPDAPLYCLALTDGLPAALTEELLK